MSSEDQLAPLIEAGAARKCQLQFAAAEEVGHAVVWRVRDHLRDEYASKETLKQISSDIGMCFSSLVRAFTREMGMPPHTYRTHVRVLRARDLIAAGRPLSDVSLEVGFVDQSHMTRHFKRLLGFTPARYASIRSIPSKPELGSIPHLQGEPGM
jgi:AraC-like DNA-binding protein